MILIHFAVCCQICCLKPMRTITIDRGLCPAASVVLVPGQISRFGSVVWTLADRPVPSVIALGDPERHLHTPGLSWPLLVHLSFGACAPSLLAVDKVLITPRACLPTSWLHIPCLGPVRPPNPKVAGNCDATRVVGSTPWG